MIFFLTDKLFTHIQHKKINADAPVHTGTGCNYPQRVSQPA